MRTRFLPLPLLAAALLLAACDRQPDTRPPSDSIEDQAAYIAAFEFGQNFHMQSEQLRGEGVELNDDAILAGFRAGLRGDSLPFTPAQADSIARAFGENITSRMGQRVRQEGEAFLTTYSAQDSVVTTDSGLRYKVVREGEGASPTAANDVVVHYEGMLTDSTVFDSSYRRGEPVRFPVTGVIPGFTEALQLMREGGRYEIVLPPDLAYGDSPQGPGGPGQTLIFTVELLEVLPPSQGQPQG
jgi:FKBP-type peptidyl-prolyl cis-trans isomerase FklB